MESNLAGDPFEEQFYCWIASVGEIVEEKIYCNARTSLVQTNDVVSCSEYVLHWAISAVRERKRVVIKSEVKKRQEILPRRVS